MILNGSKSVIYEVLHLLFCYMYAEQHKASSETELNNRESQCKRIYTHNSCKLSYLGHWELINLINTEWIKIDFN